MKTKVISVFGSARPLKGSADYECARRIGRLLAEAGVAVATGGYMGTMEAISEGAHEGGGHIIGVTSERIETFRPIGPNPYVKQEIKYTTLRDRLLHLVQENDGMIVLPGGIGTLAEVAMAWNGMQTGEIERRPFVLLGDMWRQTLTTFFDQQYIAPEYFELLHFAKTADEAVNFVIKQLAGTEDYG